MTSVNESVTVDLTLLYIKQITLLNIKQIKQVELHAANTTQFSCYVAYKIGRTYSDTELIASVSDINDLLLYDIL